MPDTRSSRAKKAIAKKRPAKPRRAGAHGSIVEPGSPPTGVSPSGVRATATAPSPRKKDTAGSDAPSPGSQSASASRRRAAPPASAEGQLAASPPPASLSPEALAALQSTIGHHFAHPELLAQALTHASVTDSRLTSNERMEFLGDSVLGLITSERIYQRFPHLLEGEMTKLKSTAVSRQTCALVTRALGLHKHLVLGKGMQNHHELPLSLEAAVLESVIAAIYLDAGYGAAEAFIAPLIDPYIARAAADGHQENFKSVLQHYAQQQSLPPPSYRVLDEKGPDHAKAFKVAVDLGGRRFTAAWGQTKKKSEQLAALNALQELGLVQARDDGHLRVVGEPG